MWLTRLRGHIPLILPAIPVDWKLDLTSTPLELVGEEETAQEVKNFTSLSLDQLIHIPQSGGGICQKASWLKLQQIYKRRREVGYSDSRDGILPTKSGTISTLDLIDSWTRAFKITSKNYVPMQWTAITKTLNQKSNHWMEWYLGLTVMVWLPVPPGTICQCPWNRHRNLEVAQSYV